MASARDIQSRIKSVQDTRKITNAMYLISSTKVKHARRDLECAEPHFYGSEALIGEILLALPELQSLWFGRPEDDLFPAGAKKGYLVISGDKGLAGAYNHNITKAAAGILKDAGNTELYVVGQLGRTALEKMGFAVQREFEYTAQNPTVDRARQIAEYLVDRYREGELSEISVIYTRMVNAGESVPTVRRLLPLEKKNFQPQEMPEGNLPGEKGADAAEIAYLPSPAAVLDCIVPNFLTGYVYGTLMEAYTSEENARMLAMKSATDSASDMLRELSVIYNSVRQAAITQQIVEVAGGAKAQKRKKSS